MAKESCLTYVLWKSLNSKKLNPTRTLDRGVPQVTRTLIFGYLSDYIRCASNVLKCLGRYPNNN